MEEAKFQFLRLAGNPMVIDPILVFSFAQVAWENHSHALSAETAATHIDRALQGLASTPESQAFLLTTWLANIRNLMVPVIPVDELNGPVGDDINTYCNAIQKRIAQAVGNNN